MEIKINLLDIYLGIDKVININIKYPSLYNCLWILLGIKYTQYILYPSCIYYIYNNIEIEDLHLLLQYNFDSSVKVLTYFEKICDNIQLTPIVRIQFIMYFIFTILNFYQLKLYYYIFTFIIGYNIYPFLCIDLKNPKNIAFIVYFFMLFIYLFDLIITFNLTLKVCNLYNGLSLIKLVDIYTILRIPAKYKWIFCLINLFISIITFDDLNNILWLFILTVKFSFRYDIDIYLEIFFQYNIMNKIKDILWNSLGYLPSYVWTSLKSNLHSLYNNPKEWYNTEGITFKKTINDINTKKIFINKFIKKLEKCQKNTFTIFISKYYFLIHFFIIFITTISFIKIYKINNYFIIFFVPITFLLNNYYYSIYTNICIDQRLTNILWQIDHYSNDKFNVAHSIIQSIYTTKTTTSGTIIGASTGGIIGYTLSSFFYASMTGGASFVCAGFGSLYLGYNNYKQAQTDLIDKKSSDENDLIYID